MKKILIIGSLVIAFVIAGCSEKADVEVDSTTTEVEGETGSTSSSGDTSTMSGSSSDFDNSNNAMENNANMDSNNLHSIYFKFDKFSIEGDKNIQTLKNNAKLITDSTYEVRVEGNTDEWGNDEYNFALGLKRASSTKDALVNNNVPVNKIKLVSYGESKPKCTEKTKECWQKNRRVDFVLIPNAQ